MPRDKARLNASTLEDELYEAIYDTYQRAGRETGYWGSYFLRMLKRRGGVVAAKRALQSRPSGKPSKGFQAMLDAGRKDLTVEAVVLKPRFRELFTPAEISEASTRLRKLQGLMGAHMTPPEVNFPGEVLDTGDYPEGTLKRVSVTIFERNSAARAVCIRKYGTRCVVCEMSFSERYGSIGKGFIHVHHKKPLAARRAEYKLNPTIDLVPVCPNCHAMLHSQNPPLGIDELQRVLRKPSSAQIRQSRETRSRKAAPQG